MGCDTYCAICGGPINGLQAENERGSSSERATRYRQSLIAAGRYQRYREGSKDAVEKHHAYHDRISHGGDDGDDDDDASGSEDAFDMERAYDPNIMEHHDQAWLGVVVFLVQDPDLTTLSKCFISNPGRFEDYNWAFASGHPERPDETMNLILYESYGMNESISFPSHRACLQMFARFVTGTPDVGALVPDLLYEVMDQDIGVGHSLLRLEYGDVSGQEQFWDCNPGEEYSVIDPLEEPSVLDGDSVRALLFERTLRMQNRGSLPTKHTTTDPFHNLSTELVTCVTEFLTGRDVLSLCQASMTVFGATDDRGFWRRLVSREMGWLWEVVNDLDESRDNIDWKSVYMLADNATSRPWGMRDEYLSLANRRRIWNVCSQLATHYWRRLPSACSAGDALRDNAISLQMPAISYPEPGASSPFSSTIANWDARAAGMTLSLAWNEKEELAGISLNELSDESYARLTPIAISKGDWLLSMTLFMEQIDVLKADASSAAVLGVRVLTSSGISHEMGKISAQLNQRYIAASQGREIIGLRGRTDDKRNRVHAIGILEANRFANPDESASRDVEAPLPFRFLWAPDSVLLPGKVNGYTEDKLHSIWRHPTITMEPPVKLGFDDGNLPKDLIPMQAIVFDERDVTGIEVMLLPDGKTTNAHGEVTRHNTGIVGIRMCLAHGPMQPWSTVGSIPPAPAEYNQHHSEHVQGWESGDYVERFDIDGPGGESLDSVGAEISQGLKAIRFRTNRQREMVFGSGSGNNFWHTQDFSSANGPRIVGFACGFATAGGWKWLDAGKGIRTIIRLTSITALTVRR